MNRRDFLKLSGQGVAAMGALHAGCGPLGWLFPRPGDALAGIYGVGEDYLHFDTDGNAYKIVSAEHKLVRLNADGSTAWEIGGLGEEDGQLNYPVAIELDSQNRIYVVDFGNSRIGVFDADGSFIRHVGEGDPTDADDSDLNFCRHIAIDSDDYLYVCDSSDHHIQVFDPDGNPSVEFGYFGDGAAELNHPRAIEIDPEGHFHVIDAGNGRIQVFDWRGRHVRSYGSFGNDVGEVRWPRSLVIDSRGNSYVVDGASGHIDVFDADGEGIEQLEPKFADGRSASPLYVTWAPGGQLYVTANPIG